MNKYLIKEGIRGLFSVDENLNLGLQDYVASRINWSYQVEQDGTLTYEKRDGSRTELEVKKGDILLEFYSGYDYPHQCIVIRNDQWKENLEASKAAALKRAEKHQDLGDVPNCEACINCKTAGV